MGRAVRILWTWAVVKGPATLTATILSVPPSAALQDTVRTTRCLEEGNVLFLSTSSLILNVMISLGVNSTLNG